MTAPDSVTGPLSHRQMQEVHRRIDETIRQWRIERGIYGMEDEVAGECYALLNQG